MGGRWEEGGKGKGGREEGGKERGDRRERKGEEIGERAWGKGRGKGIGGRREGEPAHGYVFLVKAGGYCVASDPSVQGPVLKSQ